MKSRGSSIKGQIVKVRPGFARNYLLPRGLAVPASSGNLARVEELKKAAAARKVLEVTAAQELAMMSPAAKARR